MLLARCWVKLVTLRFDSEQVKRGNLGNFDVDETELAVAHVEFFCNILAIKLVFSNWNVSIF